MRVSDFCRSAIVHNYNRKNNECIRFIPLRLGCSHCKMLGLRLGSSSFEITAAYSEIISWQKR